jgi:crotonobetainyl-CoA:carnitine CoA-transferase CaiB-like acyl-CoA transferase
VVPEQSVYRTMDGRYVAIGFLEPWLFQRACEALGCPELVPNHFTDDENLRAATQARLAALFLTRTMDEWTAFNTEHDLGISPVKNLDEVFEDPQMQHRRMVVEHDHPTAGRSKHIGVPFIFSRTPADRIRSIPRFGEHTREILVELGYDEAQIEAFFEAGVC